MPITQHNFAPCLFCLLSFSLTWSPSKSCLSPETVHGEEGHVLYPLHLSGSVTCICPMSWWCKGVLPLLPSPFSQPPQGSPGDEYLHWGSPPDFRMKGLVSSSFFVFRSVVRCSTGLVSEVLMGVLCEHDALTAAGWAGESRACTKAGAWLLSKNGLRLSNRPKRHWLAQM